MNNESVISNSLLWSVESSSIKYIPMCSMTFSCVGMITNYWRLYKIHLVSIRFNWIRFHFSRNYSLTLKKITFNFNDLAKATKSHNQLTLTREWVFQFNYIEINKIKTQREREGEREQREIKMQLNENKLAFCLIDDTLKA